MNRLLGPLACLVLLLPRLANAVPVISSFNFDFQAQTCGAEDYELFSDRDPDTNPDNGCFTASVPWIYDPAGLLGGYTGGNVFGFFQFEDKTPQSGSLGSLAPLYANAITDAFFNFGSFTFGFDSTANNEMEIQSRGAGTMGQPFGEVAFSAYGGLLPALGLNNLTFDFSSCELNFNFLQLEGLRPTVCADGGSLTIRAFGGVDNRLIFGINKDQGFRFTTSVPEPGSLALLGLGLGGIGFARRRRQS